MNSVRVDTDVVRSDQNNCDSTRTLAEASSDRMPRSLALEREVEPLPEKIDRFRILRRLGQGAFGVVYLAHDPVLDREIALKTPRHRGAWSAERLQSFLHEARTAARLKNPHVVTVYEAGTCPETEVYIALEYVAGESLGDRLRRGKLSIEESVRVCGQIADAVQQAHKLGLVHRDLKPSNVLLDREGNAHVCDFGLALLEDQQTHYRGEVSGTLPYMSPEQVRGEAHLLDGRADLWSMGVVLYECLTGKRPFHEGERLALEESILTRDPKPLRQIDETLPKPLDQLCQRCLDRDLRTRLRSAADFKEMLAAEKRLATGPRKRLWLGAVVGVLLLAGAAALAAAAWSWLSAGVMFSPPSPSRRDLLARQPEPFLCPVTQPDHNFFYSASMRRLVIASPHWSLFECGEHPAAMKLDISTLNGNPPGTSGAFWGLHQDRNGHGHNTWQCLLIAVCPHEPRPQETSVRLYRFHGYVGSNSISSNNYGETRLDSELTAPLRLGVKVVDGELRGVRINDVPIALPLNPRAKVDWRQFAEGKCGLVSYQRQVSFTRAFLTSED